MMVESIARTANKQRRCLVVVYGFYEWKRDGNGKRSRPFLLHEADGHPFALGMEPLTTNNGEVIDTVAGGAHRPSLARRLVVHDDER